MVSPISTPSRRLCPALDTSISVKRCVAERVLKLDCPLTCQFNPFNPDAPQAFDAIVGRGLAGAARWLEKTVGGVEWSRRFDAMDRRFMPERDLPLIAYETQWAILNLAKEGEAYPKVSAALRGEEGTGLKNDARLVFDKLLNSRAMLVQVTEADPTLPYYGVRNVFNAEEEFLYVDFGDQEPLEVGALMFGRFLVHGNCIYVIPGVFVGTPASLGVIVEAITEFLDEDLEGIEGGIQVSLPEIWNLCTAIQDEQDGLHLDGGYGKEGFMPEDPCRVTFMLDADKADAVEALRRHPFFSEIDAPEFGFDPFGESVFDVLVTPAAVPPVEGYEDELDADEYDDQMEGAGEPVRVGSVSVSSEKLSISALNPVEMELLKALVLQLVACSDA